MTRRKAVRLGQEIRAQHSRHVKAKLRGGHEGRAEKSEGMTNDDEDDEKDGCRRWRGGEGSRRREIGQ